MKIIDTNGHLKLIYSSKIVSKKKKYKKKDGVSEYIFYQSYFPPEIKEYFKVKDNTIYFYEYDNEIRITSKCPKVEFKSIKIQRYNQFSIPRTFFKNPEHFTHVKLILDFSKVDDYKNGLGVLTITLI